MSEYDQCYVDRIGRIYQEFRGCFCKFFSLAFPDIMVYVCRESQYSHAYVAKNSQRVGYTGTVATGRLRDAMWCPWNIIQVNCESYTLLGLVYQFNYSLEQEQGKQPPAVFTT